MNRIESFRRIEGVTQEDVGDRLGVTSQMISAVEKGIRPPTFSLAPLGYSDRRFETPSMSEPLHRQLRSTRVGSNRRAKELLRLGGEVTNLLRPLVPRAPIPRLERIAWVANDLTIEDVAAIARVGVLNCEEEGPIKNLTKVVEEAGIVLIPIAALPGVDGLSAWVEDQPVIGLSPAVPGDRFRLTLAHEIGHLILHQAKGDQCESEANLFAAALLMPDDEFEAAMLTCRQSISDFVNLKKTWGLSIASLVFRAHRAGFIDDRRYRSLQVQMSQWKRSEPAHFNIVPGQLLPTLVKTVGGVRQTSETLEMREEHIRELVTWSHLRSV